MKGAIIGRGASRSPSTGEPSLMTAAGHGESGPAGDESGELDVHLPVEFGKAPRFGHGDRQGLMVTKPAIPFAGSESTRHGSHPLSRSDDAQRIRYATT